MAAPRARRGGELSGARGARRIRATLMGARDAHPGRSGVRGSRGRLCCTRRGAQWCTQCRFLPACPDGHDACRLRNVRASRWRRCRCRNLVHHHLSRPRATSDPPCASSSRHAGCPAVGLRGDDAISAAGRGARRGWRSRWCHRRRWSAVERGVRTVACGCLVCVVAARDCFKAAGAEQGG